MGIYCGIHLFALRCYAVLYIVPQSCDEVSQNFIEIDDAVLTNCTYNLYR